eukprot:Lankesteria_metandrocarpae@DN7138_c0_g1_i1.p1
MTEKLPSVVESELLRALEVTEKKLDDEITAYTKLDDDDLDTLRERALQQRKTQAQASSDLRSKGHGFYTELTTEREFFNAAKTSKFLAVHFYRPTTIRCTIVDKHMEAVATRHLNLRCVKINVEKAPFLAERLKIIVIPTVMLVKEAKTEHSIIGFDEMGGKDDFKTSAFESVLVRHGMLRSKRPNSSGSEDSSDS